MTIWHDSVRTAAKSALVAGTLFTCWLTFRRAPPFRRRLVGAVVIGVAAYAFLLVEVRYGRWSLESRGVGLGTLDDITEEWREW